MAVIAASSPLLPWIPPARSRACCWLFGVKTPKITGLLYFNETLVKPISGTKLASRICQVIDSPRPFIDVIGYFGPDRRRQAVPFRGRDRRVTTAEQIQVINDRTQEF